MRFLYRVVKSVMDAWELPAWRGLKRAPTFQEPDALSLRRALERGDWKAAEDRLRRSESWADRFHWTALCSDWQSDPPWLQQWLDAEPNSPDALLVAGATSMSVGWAARGSGYARTVSEAGARRFFECLEQSHGLLQNAAAHGPEDPTPWAYLIRVARGLGEAPATASIYLKEAKRRDAHHYFAHYEYLQGICAKWYGSHAQMWEFARATGAAAPSGSSLQALIAVAHFEQAGSIGALDELANPDKVEREYWTQAHVEQGLLQAFRKLESGGGATEPDRLQAYSEFAYALWRCGAHQAGAKAFEAIDNRVTYLPWAVNSSPARTFRRAKRECFRG